MEMYSAAIVKITATSDPSLWRHIAETIWHSSQSDSKGNTVFTAGLLTRTLSTQELEWGGTYPKM